MLWLLAQLVEPALQPGPIRLPSNAPIERAAPATAAPAVELSPELKDSRLYTPEALRDQLERCQQKNSTNNNIQNLNNCAAALTAQLVAKGYLNSRVIVDQLTNPARLELVEGRLVELRVQSSNTALARRVRTWLAPLQQGPLRVDLLEESLQKIRQRPDIAAVRGSLGRLGSDPAKAVLNISVEPAAQPIRGEISLRNDGNPGTGEARGVIGLSKIGLLQNSDQLLIFTEINTDRDPEVGYVLGSISYTANLNNELSFTSAFGYSRRNLIEIDQPYHDLSYRQLQSYGQLNWNLIDGLSSQLYAFAGLSVNRNDAFLADKAFPLLVGGNNNSWLRTGFIRAGLGFNNSGQSLAWGGQLYGLQGIQGFSTPNQQLALAEVGIRPGEARAIGASLSGSWLALPKLQLSVRSAAQWALNPLTSDMGFSIGSDSGLRGLPGQLVSGDSGYLGYIEAAYTLWKGSSNRLQLVPFIGAGGVESNRNSINFNDTAGAGGAFLRWQQGNTWSVELGWVGPFQTEAQTLWNNWLISDGLYSQIKVRF